MPLNKLFAGSTNTIPVQCIEEMTVHSYNTDTNRLWVLPKDGRPVEAILLSVSPTSDQGAGFFVDPKPGTNCVVLRQGKKTGDTVIWYQQYVLGFHSVLNELGTRGGVMTNDPSSPGDVTWNGTGQTYIRQTKFGTLGFFVNLWNRLEMSQVTQTLTTFLRNLKLRMRGGKLEWFTTTENISNLHAEVHDKYESDVDNDVNNGTSTNYANKVILDAGTLPEGNILDIQTRQDTDGDNIADEFTKIRIGRPSSGALKEEEGSSAAGQQEYKEQYLVDSNTALSKSYTHGDNNAVRTSNVDTKAGRIDEITFDDETVTMSTGRGLDNKPLIKFQALDKNTNAVLQEVLVDDATMYKIDINNGKAVLNVDKDGNVTITSATGNIYLGGTGQEQSLVTKYFVDAIYPAHTHVCASPGSPSSMPVQPVVALPADSSSNVVTVTTKAE